MARASKKSRLKHNKLLLLYRSGVNFKQLAIVASLVVVVGIYVVARSLAATATFNWSGRVTASSPSVTYSLSPAGTGNLAASLTWSKSAVLSLRLIDSSGTIVGQQSGQSPLNLSAPVTQGRYKLRVTWQSGVSRVPFTLSGVVVTADPADTTAPTTPTGLQATATSSTSVTLAWGTSTDNVAVSGYRVYRDGVEIGSVRDATYSDAGLVASTSYMYAVAAFDAAGNFSATSTPVSVTTPAVSPSPSPSLWRPTSAVPLTLHWVLADALDTSDPVQMGLRDLNGNVLPAPDVYDIDGEYNSKITVDALHAQGKKAICYIDAGVYETYRSDAYKFQALTPQIWGSADAGWNGSYWLDIRRINDLAPIMQARMQMCKDKGFDAIEPDEITGWSNNSGFPLTYADQIAYNRAVATWAHNIGMSIGLKGDLEQAHDLVSNFDWTLNEECFQYNECTTVYNIGPGADGKAYPGLQLFAQAGKAVWVAEYKSYTATQWDSLCSTSRTQHFNTARYKLGLPNNGGRLPCPTSSATTW